MPPPVNSRCVCDTSLDFPGHIYLGRRVPQWGGLTICRDCERNNPDGIVIRMYPKLQEHIEAAWGKVTVNGEGHIVVPTIGSN